MTITLSATQVATDTRTRAEANHFSGQLLGEMRTIFVRPGLWTESYAEKLRDDIFLWLVRGNANAVALRLKNSLGQVVFELNYKFSPWNGVAQDQAGRGYTRPTPYDGLEPWVVLTRSAKYEAMSASDKADFKGGLALSWGDAPLPTYSSGGSWRHDDRTHVKDASMMTRSSFSLY